MIEVIYEIVKGLYSNNIQNNRNKIQEDLVGSSYQYMVGSFHKDDRVQVGQKINHKTNKQINK